MKFSKWKMKLKLKLGNKKFEDDDEMRRTKNEGGDSTRCFSHMTIAS